MESRSITGSVPARKQRATRRGSGDLGAYPGRLIAVRQRSPRPPPAGDRTRTVRPGRRGPRAHHLPARQLPIELHESCCSSSICSRGDMTTCGRGSEEEWAAARDKADVLRKHWLIDEAQAYPVDALRTRLDETGRTAPDDDRVWLGRAYLAIRTAQFAEADAWLKKCLQRVPKTRSSGGPGWNGRWPPTASRRPSRPCGTCRPTARARPAPVAPRLAGRSSRRRACGAGGTGRSWFRRVSRATPRLSHADRAGGAGRPDRAGRPAPPPQGGARPGTEELSQDF